MSENPWGPSRGQEVLHALEVIPFAPGLTPSDAPITDEHGGSIKLKKSSGWEQGHKAFSNPQVISTGRAQVDFSGELGPVSLFSLQNSEDNDYFK